MREVRGRKVTMSKKPARVTVSDERGMLATMNVLLSDEDVESLPRRPRGYGLSCVSTDRHFFSLPQGSPLWIEGPDVLCAWVRPYAVFRASLKSLYAARRNRKTGVRSVPCRFQNRPDMERLRSGLVSA